MSTRDIRTSTAASACDVCGRTLLRGERAEVYLNGGARRSVCELCKSRAINEGWVREGTMPAYDGADQGRDRRRSFLSRLRSRRDSATNAHAAPAPDPEPAGLSWQDEAAGGLSRVREPRHVRAVPTSVEHKIASAMEMFNASEHRKTIAGVARSLGLPGVSLRPSDARPSVVNVVVSWELCWYRYEVDLSEDEPSVRVAGQGYELDELTPAELEANAVSDAHGTLRLSA